MNNHSGSLPLTRLIAYGGLGLPLAALNLPLFVYLPTYYADSLGVPLITVGLILLIARLLDVASDPLIGALSDSTRTRFGRRIPWLVGSAPLLILASYMLFIPDSDAGAGHLFFWSTLAYLAWTAMVLSYAAIGAEFSPDYHERTRITMTREGFVVVGILLAAALPVLLRAEPSSRAVLEAIFWSMALALPVFLLISITSLPSQRQPQGLPLGFWVGLKIAWANRPFKRLIIAYLLNGIANGLPATLFLLFAEHRLGAPDQAGLFLLIYFAAGVLAIPFWLRLSFRFGKHRTWAASMLWACLIFASVLLLGEGNIAAFIVICLLSGMSLGADLALPASIQADIVDLDHVQSGRERTGLFFGLWGMTTKLALTLAVGIAFPVLGLIGFQTDITNNGGTIWVLTLLYGGLPVLIKLAAVSIIWNFELDEQALHRLHEVKGR